MKTIGIQIKSSEAILVVLEKDINGVVSQTNESVKFGITDPTKGNQVKQFRDQINAAFDSIKPNKIAIVARNANAKGDRTPSPVSFKLEGIIQLYDKVDVELFYKITTMSFFKKNALTGKAKHKYQDDAYELAHYLISK